MFRVKRRFLLRARQITKIREFVEKLRRDGNWSVFCFCCGKYGKMTFYKICSERERRLGGNQAVMLHKRMVGPARFSCMCTKPFNTLEIRHWKRVGITCNTMKKCELFPKPFDKLRCPLNFLVITCPS